MPQFRHLETGQVIGVDEKSSRAPVLRSDPRYEEVSEARQQEQSMRDLGRDMQEERMRGPSDRSQLETENKAVLLTYAANRGLSDVKSHWTKAEIIDAIVESE